VPWPNVISVWTVAALTLLVGCREEPKREEAPSARVEAGRVVFPPDSPQIAILTTEIVVAATPAIVRIPGRLVWDEERTARVYPGFTGRVVKILAKPGDTASVGQPLALVASPEFGQAQAEARKEAADLALAEQSLARLRDLVANGVAPKKDLYAVEAEYARARAAFTRARDRVKLYGGGEAVDSTFALRSPIEGTVVERSINPGQELRADSMGNAPALFVVTDPSRLWLQLDATERELSLLRPGQEVRLNVTAYPDDAFTAHIDSVADFVDPQTRTIRVRGSVRNPRRKLKGEMFVTADLEGPPRIGFMVPAKAVFLSGSRNFVFVQEAPGRYARTEVHTAGEQEGTVLAIAGVHEGQRVVVHGNLFLQQIYQTKGGS
jgi:cobalt-zinc-cadmium efflux system membrane fusion protein